MNTPALLTSTAIALSLSGCLTIPEMEYQPPDISPAATTSTSAAATAPSSSIGTWGGRVIYNLPNGETMVMPTIVRVGPMRDRVTCQVEGSDPETAVANWSGSTVSWSSLGDSSVSEWHLVPISARTAKVSAICTMQRGIIIKGSGTFTKQ